MTIDRVSVHYTGSMPELFAYEPALEICRRENIDVSSHVLERDASAPNRQVQEIITSLLGDQEEQTDIDSSSETLEILEISVEQATILFLPQGSGSDPKCSPGSNESNYFTPEQVKDGKLAEFLSSLVTEEDLRVIDTTVGKTCDVLAECPGILVCPTAKSA
jgi:hypothetical protein